MGGAVVLAAAAALASPLLTTTASAGSIQSAGHNIQTADNEAHLVIEAGKEVTKEVACPAGYFATSGGFLADAVDDGDNAAVFVLASRATSTSLGWIVKVRNDNDSRAQGKVKVSCVGLSSSKAKDGHAHAFQPSIAGVGDTRTGVTEDTSGLGLTASCADGRIPVRPWFEATGAAFQRGVTVGAPVAGTTTVTFDFEAAEPTNISVGVECLNPTLEAGAGHAPAVSAVFVTAKSLSFRGGISEQVVACPAGSVSLLPSWSTEEPGLYFLGSDPRGTQRMYRFANDFDEASAASLGMTCLAAANAPAKGFEIGAATVSGKKLNVQVTSTVAGAVTVKVYKNNSSKVFATGKATFKAAGTKVVRTTAKSAGLAVGDKVTVVVVSGKVKVEKLVTIS